MTSQGEGQPLGAGIPLVSVYSWGALQRQPKCCRNRVTQSVGRLAHESGSFPGKFWGRLSWFSLPEQHLLPPPSPSGSSPERPACVLGRWHGLSERGVLWAPETGTLGGYLKISEGTILPLQNGGENYTLGAVVRMTGSHSQGLSGT